MLLTVSETIRLESKYLLKSIHDSKPTFIMRIEHNWKSENGKDFVYNQEARHFWRYLSIADFISLLTTKKIRFSRVDAFDDPIEGMRYTEIEDYQYWTTKDIATVRTELKEDFHKAKNNRPKDIKRRVLSSQKKTFASCWHFEEYESLAMWNSYASGEGVAIKIQNPYLFEYMIKKLEVKRIRNAVAFFGDVRYFPLFPFAKFRDSYGQPPVGATPYFKKQWSYRHEGEYRFLIVLDRSTTRKSIDFKLDRNVLDNTQFIAHPDMKAHKVKALNEVLVSLGYDIKLRNSEIPMKKALYYF